MKHLWGILLILIGCILGLYVGGYLCLIGGVIQIIEQIQAPVIQASEIAWGVARIMCCSLCGGLSAVVFVLPGIAIMQS